MFSAFYIFDINAVRRKSRVSDVFAVKFNFNQSTAVFVRAYFKTALGGVNLGFISEISAIKRESLICYRVKENFLGTFHDFYIRAVKFNAEITQNIARLKICFRSVIKLDFNDICALFNFAEFIFFNVAVGEISALGHINLLTVKCDFSLFLGRKPNVAGVNFAFKFVNKLNIIRSSVKLFRPGLCVPSASHRLADKRSYFVVNAQNFSVFRSLFAV